MTVFKKLVFSVIALTGFAASNVLPAFAQTPATPRLMLWATGPIGASDGAQCALAQDAQQEAAAMAARTTLTEEDVGSWNPVNGHWVLAPRFFSADSAAQLLRDHCFVFAIDGKVLARGMALASESARLTALPTLRIHRNGNAPYVQVTSGNQGNPAQVIHADALDAVLGNRANLEQQLKRLDQNNTPDRMLNLGKEWVAAVEQSIAQHKIYAGVSLKELSAILGEPTLVPRGYTGRYSWYFNTARHVNPVLDVAVKDGIVQNYRLQSR